MGRASAPTMLEDGEDRRRQQSEFNQICASLSRKEALPWQFSNEIGPLNSPFPFGHELRE